MYLRHAEVGHHGVQSLPLLLQLQLQLAHDLVNGGKTIRHLWHRFNCNYETVRACGVLSHVPLTSEGTT